MVAGGPRITRQTTCCTVLAGVRYPCPTLGTPFYHFVRHARLLANGGMPDAAVKSLDGVVRQPLPLLIIWWHTSNGAGFGKLEMAQMCGAWATGGFAKRMKLAAS